MQTIYVYCKYFLDLNTTSCGGMAHNSVHAAGRCIFGKVTGAVAVSWFVARQQCRESGGTLLVIDDGDVIDAVRSLQDGDVELVHSWIGLSNSLWKWRDGNPISIPYMLIFFHSDDYIFVNFTKRSCCYVLNEVF